eukprot:TRINITY_DN23812_c0_g1_i1.p1 TRINITY_DN23812_c0_g1~~TRINITY_DN23812_c0_g1_i1.p1  ORF type:complete len:705 (+),score=322.09 TRINITY_DN23812_c0_g1_i1:123-2237(+)
MKVASGAVALAVGVAAISDAATVTPVQKAIEMLQGMLSAARTGAKEEAVQYAAYRQFCDDTTVEKQKAVQEADEKIEVLKAHIQKFDTEAERLAEEVVAHESDIKLWQNDTAVATDDRKLQREDFMKKKQDYEESLKALGQAIEALKKEAYDRPSAGTAALLQQVGALSSQFEPMAGKKITAFLAQEPDLTFVANSPPEAHAYEFRSNDIIVMLEQLKDKFRAELTTMEKEDMENRHAYDQTVQGLRHSQDAAKANIKAKTAAEAKNRQDSADASATLQDTQATRTDDNAYLEELVATCQQKSSDFKSRKTLREEEILALEKAVEILGGSKVTGAAEKHLRQSLVAKKGSTSLAQLRSTRSVQEKAAAYLKAASDRLGSSVLSALAVHAEEDPFGKVKKLIQDLITHLETQAAEEADHKAWCDTELTENEQTRTTKTSEVEGLHSEADKLQAEIAKLKQDIAELWKSVAEIAKAVKEATELRSKEKAENEATLQDAKDGQTAIAEVIQVLQDFYGKAADATALLQDKSDAKQQPTPPPVFDEPFKGQQTDSKNVLAMMEVIQSDFARLESETAEAEANAANEHDNFMETSTADKEQKNKDIKDKTTEQTNKEGDLLNTETDLENAQKELDAAMVYYDKLKPSCVNAGTSYGDRVGRREEEIQSLKEALSILDGEIHGEVIQGVLVKDQATAGPLRSETSGVAYD